MVGISDDQTISGNSGHDAKSYQENQVRRAIREVESESH